MLADRHRHRPAEPVVDVDERRADRLADAEHRRDDSARDGQARERRDEAVGNVEAIPQIELGLARPLAARHEHRILLGHLRASGAAAGIILSRTKRAT